MDKPHLSIEMLPAEDGDALWLEYGDGRSRSAILIDGGRESTNQAIRARLAALSSPVELLVLTHIDADHLEGVVRLLLDRPNALKVGGIWYNGFHHLPANDPDPDNVRRGSSADGNSADDLPRSPQQGEFVSALLHHLELKAVWNSDTNGQALQVSDDGALPEFALSGGMKMTLLSPNREALIRLREIWDRSLAAKGLTAGDSDAFLQMLSDRERSGGRQDKESQYRGATEPLDTSATNGSSIALLAEFGGMSALLLGDAHAPQIESSIRRLLATRGGEKLRVDALKLSHHGSRGNMTASLAGLIDARHVLISTNGAKHRHPDPEPLEQLISTASSKNIEFHFNYESACRPELARSIAIGGHCVRRGNTAIDLSFLAATTTVGEDR